MVNRAVTDHAGVVLIILALVSAFQLAYFSWQNRQNTNCQTRYNIALANNLQVRSEYTDRDRASLVTFIRRISEAKTREESRASLNDYLAEQNAIETERAKHPIPKLPPGKCS